MIPFSRPELNARLETIEARMDARLAEIQASVASMALSCKETQDSIRNLKVTILWTAITSVIAIVFGVATFNASLLANMVASFESGKNTSEAQAEIRRQSDETARILREIQAQLAEQKKTKPPAGG